MPMPVAEQKTVTESYLDFLKEQISLNARGEEWTAILRRRLNALDPFKGRELIQVSFAKGKNQCFVRVEPTSLNIVHWEVLEG